MNFRIFLFSLSLFAVGLLGMFGYSTYDYYKSIHADDPRTPSLVVDLGSAIIVRGDTTYELTAPESYDLATGDAVETKIHSKATINWPDHSVTRLGENTRIVISKMEVSSDYNSIKISMEMKRGKIWSNVVRTMLGDSYFETHLPKNDIVAAVRGTVYEINLDAGYIHAVSHSMNLSDISGKALSLLPGELVSSDNIWIVRGQDILDTAWASWNHITDTTYLDARLQMMKANLSHISGSDASGIWDRFVRYILGWFPDFSSLKISESLHSGDLTGLVSTQTDVLMSYYQKYQGLDFSTERDRIRSVIMEKIGTEKASAPLLNSLKNSAIWDMVENPESALPGAQKLLDDNVGNAKNIIQDIRSTLDPKNLDPNIKIQVKKWLSF